MLTSDGEICEATKFYHWSIKAIVDNISPFSIRRRRVQGRPPGTCFDFAYASFQQGARGQRRDSRYSRFDGDGNQLNYPALQLTRYVCAA